MQKNTYLGLIMYSIKYKFLLIIEGMAKIKKGNWLQEDVLITDIRYCNGINLHIIDRLV